MGVKRSRGKVNGVPSAGVCKDWTLCMSFGAGYSVLVIDSAVGG